MITIIHTNNIDHNLYILTNQNTWINTTYCPNSQKYKDTFESAKKVLGFLHNSGTINNGTLAGYLLNSTSQKTKIIHNESHRYCTIVACEQYDEETKNTRYIVYGMQCNLLGDSYRPGKTLKDIDCFYMDEWCPSHIISKYI